MDARFDAAGIQALAHSLAKLPEEIQRRASAVIQDAAVDLYADMSARFPAKDHTGNLRRSIRASSTGPLRVSVYAGAPHAHLYEHGHTRLNGKRIAGANVWIPAAISIRTRMLDTISHDVIPQSARAVGLSSGS